MNSWSGLRLGAVSGRISAKRLIKFPKEPRRNAERPIGVIANNASDNPAQSVNVFTAASAGKNDHMRRTATRAIRWRIMPNDGGPPRRPSAGVEAIGHSSKEEPKKYISEKQPRFCDD
jgi:hypothetical protein